MPETTLIHSLTSSKIPLPVAPSHTWWLAPTPLVLFFSILLAVSIPLLLHLFIYRSSSSSTLPTFLLVGPSGSGKTTLQTLIERTPVPPSKTVTSQLPLTIESSVPVTFSIASNRYRSAADPSTQTHKKFLLTDTPGHGKLRHHALSLIKSAPKTSHLRGIIFVLDSTALGAETAGLRDAADYLHDVLLGLQGSVGTGKEMPVLVLVNKGDLFTALPMEMAGTVLEKEVGRVRESRSKGLMEAGTGEEGRMDESDDRWLGQGGEGAFEWRQMEDAGVLVTVKGSSLEGEGDVGAVWEWMGEQL